jgi:hypothetical protein
MKNLYDMVVEAVTALNNGFSAHNVTEWVRQMTKLAEQNNEDLDLPLSDDPAFKWYVSHNDVKRVMEQLYIARTVDRWFSNNGYFLYLVVANAPTVAPVTAAPVSAPVTVPVTSLTRVLTNPSSTLLVKLINYIDGFSHRNNGLTPTAKQVQSRLKRDCNLTCRELVTFAKQNNIPVTLGATLGVSTIGS